MAQNLHASKAALVALVPLQLYRQWSKHMDE